MCIHRAAVEAKLLRSQFINKLCLYTALTTMNLWPQRLLMEGEVLFD